MINIAYINNANLSFYDFKLKKNFIPAEFIVKQKGGKKFAIAINPKTGCESWRTLTKGLILKKINR